MLSSRVHFLMGVDGFGKPDGDVAAKRRYQAHQGLLPADPDDTLDFDVISDVIPVKCSLCKFFTYI